MLDLTREALLPDASIGLSTIVVGIVFVLACVGAALVWKNKKKDDDKDD